LRSSGQSRREPRHHRLERRSTPPGRAHNRRANRRPGRIYEVAADIFSPNALGAIINPDTLPRLRVRVVAGGANNQLATPETGDRLREMGIVYAPDYVINGGGIINVASEISGAYDPAWVEAKLQRLMQTLGDVLDQAQREDRAANRVADEIARSRINP
jgi:leucine dehydrogenase